jgi:hypothetical protein
MASALSEASVNEVAALAKKAARGAGYSWSLADEAAFAVSWLCHRGLDGPGALAAHLQHVHGVDLATIQLQSLQQPWVGGENGLCALACGTALTDALHVELTDEQIYQRVITPYLLLPFLAYRNEQLCKRTQRPWQTLITTATFKAELTSTNTHTAVKLHDIEPAITTAYQPAEGTVNCRIIKLDAQLEVHEKPSLHHRLILCAKVLETLNGFATNTYAPATEASRQGAGAVNTDND